MTLRFFVHCTSILRFRGSASVHVEVKRIALVRGRKNRDAAAQRLRATAAVSSSTRANATDTGPSSPGRRTGQRLFPRLISALSFAEAGKVEATHPRDSAPTPWGLLPAALPSRLKKVVHIFEINGGCLYHHAFVYTVYFLSVHALYIGVCGIAPFRREVQTTGI